jgi:hypothetical protein
MNAADTWEYKTVSIPGDVAGTWVRDNSAALFVRIVMAAGASAQIAPNVWTASGVPAATGQINGIAATSDYMKLTGVILLPGTLTLPSAQTPWMMRSHAAELWECLRYLYVWNSQGRVSEPIGSLNTYSGVVAACAVPFQRSMRAVPTFSYSALGDFAWLCNGANGPPTALGVDVPGLDFFSVLVTMTIASGQGGYWRGNSASARMYFDARL